MAIAYSNDLRKKIVEAINSKKMKKKEISKQLNINIRTIQRWLTLQRKTGSIKSKTGYQNGHNHKIIDLNTFQKFVEANPSLTQLEMAEKWGNVSKSTIARALKKINFTVKKNNMVTKSGMKKSVWNSDKK